MDDLDFALKYSRLSPYEQEALLNGPAMDLPPGVRSNFDNPSNMDTLGLTILSICTVISFAAILVRGYSRVFFIKKVTVSDYSAIVAFGLFIGYQYFAFVAVVSSGFAVHQWDIRFRDLSHFFYNVTMASAIYDLVMIFMKLAIILDLTSIFVPLRSRNLFFWVSHTVLALNLAFYIAGFFMEVFACTPREKIWNKLVIGGTCLDWISGIITSGVINMISDVVILILPQTVIWKLHISKEKKIGISVLFAIGIFACISAIYRLALIFKMTRTDDLSFYMTGIGLWNAAEVTCGFLILSIPTIPKILKDTPWGQGFITLVRSWASRSGSNRAGTSSRRGLPSWYKSPTSNVRKQTSDVELDEHCLMPSDSMPRLQTVDASKNPTSSVRSYEARTPPGTDAGYGV